MELQGLFPLALARVPLRLDPWDLALLMQEVLALRGEAEGNPNEGCAWTGDINGVWQIHRLPAFAAISEEEREVITRFVFQQQQPALPGQPAAPARYED